ncbi:MAG: GNAT family N-acetyltransferase [Burkholderiaceae bacterium]
MASAGCGQFLAARWIRAWPEAAALAPAWNAIAPDLFTRFEWFDAAWAWAGRDAQPRLLAVFDGELLVGLLPACLWHRGGRRELALITVPDTQFADVLLGPDPAPVARVMAEALVAARGEWDELHLTHLRPDGEWTRLRDALTRLTAVDCAPYARNLRIALDAPWAAYYASLSKTVREKNKLAANRLARTGQVEIEWHRGENPAPAALTAEITAISAASWKAETGLSLENAGPGAFIERLTQHAAAQGWLSVWLARLDGTAVAMEYQLIDAGRVYALRSDFRAEQAQVSPGTYLNWKLLERLAGEGLSSYFMGPGENAYKLRWTREGAQLWQLTAWSPTWRGALLRLIETRIKPAARAWRDWLRRWRGGNPTKEAQ